MNKVQLFFSIVLFYAFAATALPQHIVVNDTYTAQQLVENVLLNSPCATSANYTVSGDTFSGSNSYGYFSYSGTAFPFSNGIVLSTSRAFRTQGPNSDLIDEGSTSWAGDADLEQALDITGTFNATVLEFDFTPLTDKISFDYLFASEEYHGNALCRYSDGFAFLLRPANSTAPYQNLALIPNTNIPVKVTSVHPAVAGTNGCPAENEAYFGGFNGLDYPINFDGQTTVMTAKANVTPGVTYHIKLVIADEENIRYDSAIFLKGGSFTVGVDLGPDRLMATNNPLCNGQSLVLDATIAGNNTYQWFKDGNLIPTATASTYTVTQPGLYKAQVVLGSGSCIAEGQVTIEYAGLPILNNQTLVQCDPDQNGSTLFNLSQLDALITAGNPQMGAVTYYNSLPDAQSQTNPITSPAVFNSTNGQVIASAANNFGCYGYAAIDLVIATHPLSTPAPVKKCDDAQPDGITTFDLNTAVTPLVTAGLPTGLNVVYYATEHEALMQTNPLPNLFTNTTPLQQTIYARIINGADCYGLLAVVLQVLVFNPPALEDQTVFMCDNAPVGLSVPGGYSGYLWSNGAVTPAITATQPGTYSVMVTNSSGCTKTKVFNVMAMQSVEIEAVVIDDFNGVNNTVSIQATGSGNLQFSLDGVYFQQDPVFTNVQPGLYTVFAQNDCGLKSRPIAVLDYPKFFTPNGDGINDIWQIKNLQTIPKATVSIFDRYGQLVYRFNEKQQGWNGRAGNTPLWATDYWFVIEFVDRTSVKGHFSLKR